MKDEEATKAQLLKELAEARRRVAELETAVADRQRAEEELKQVNSILKAIRNINQLIVRESDKAKLMQHVCEILITVREYRFAWIGFIEEGHKRVLPVAQAGFEESYLGSIKITWDDAEIGKGPTGTAIKMKQPSVMRNIPEDPRYEPWREEALKRGYLSSVAIPLVHGEKVYGALNVYSHQRDGFDDEETGLLVEIGSDLAFALKAIDDAEERQRAEDELQESEDKYRTIFETTGTATVIIEEDSTISLANSEFEKLSGYSREELEGKKSWAEFVAKDDLERMKEYHRLRRIDPDAVPKNYEFRFFDRQGNVKDIFSAVAIIPGTKKAVASLLDITERKRGEEKLGKIQEKFLKAFNLGPSPMVITRLDDGKFIVVSDAFTRLYGYNRENIIGQTALEIGLWPKPEQRDKMIRMLRKNGVVRNLEVEFRTKSGEIRDVLFSAESIDLEDEKCMVTVTTDITERKKMEEQLIVTDRLASIGELVARGCP